VIWDLATKLGHSELCFQDRFKYFIIITPLILFLYGHIWWPGDEYLMENMGDGAFLCINFPTMYIFTQVIYFLIVQIILLYLFTSPLCKMSNETQRVNEEDDLVDQINDVIRKHSRLGILSTATSLSKYIILCAITDSNFGYVLKTCFLFNLDFVINNYALAFLMNPMIIYDWCFIYYLPLDDDEHYDSRADAISFSLDSQCETIASSHALMEAQRSLLRSSFVNKRNSLMPINKKGGSRFSPQQVNTIEMKATYHRIDALLHQDETSDHDGIKNTIVSSKR